MFFITNLLAFNGDTTIVITLSHYLKFQLYVTVLVLKHKKLGVFKGENGAQIKVEMSSASYL